MKYLCTKRHKSLFKWYLLLAILIDFTILDLKKINAFFKLILKSYKSGATWSGL